MAKGKIAIDDIDGVFDSMFPQGESNKSLERRLGDSETSRLSDQSTKRLVDQETKRLVDTSTKRLVNPEEGQSKLGPNAQGGLKKKGLHLYTRQAAEIRRLAEAGKDEFGQGLSESIIVRCAIELLLSYDLELRPNMTEEELWEEVVRKCVRHGD